jgi:hypothetical protein
MTSLDQFLTTPPVGLQDAYVKRIIETVDTEFVDEIELNKFPHRFVLVWDQSFKCRAYSAIRQNMSFAVTSLDGVWCNVSVIVDVTR